MVAVERGSYGWKAQLRKEGGKIESTHVATQRYCTSFNLASARADLSTAQTVEQKGKKKE